MTRSLVAELEPGESVSDRARKCVGFCFWWRDGRTVAMSFAEIVALLREFEGDS